MKKLFIIAAAALVASVACSKVETIATPDQEIGFQVASYLSQTKADSHGHTSFVDELTEVGAASNYFKSVAYIHAAQADGSVAAPALFFTAGDSGRETISYDGTSTWKPAHPYYWPKSPKSSISFFSWYDFEDKVTPSISGYTADGADVTLAWADRTVALKDNVMYADAAYHYKKNANGDQNHKLNDVTEGVPTLFHHALAKVRFTIAQNPMKEQDGSSDYYTFWDVTLSDVALSSGSIKTKGQLSLTETSKTTATTQGSWTLPNPAIWDNPTGAQVFLTTNLNNATGAIFDTDVARGVDSSSNPVLLTAAAKDLSGENFMANHYFTVLPQAIGNDVTLTFKYTIKQYYGTQAQYDSNKASILISTETINVNDYGPTVSGATYGAPYTDNGIQLNAITGAWANWLMNHRYVYNIIINPKSELILYDPAVEDWAAEDTVDQTVPAA
jgi:hypothetical protein